MSPLSMSQRAEPGPIYKVSWPEGSRLLKPLPRKTNSFEKSRDRFRKNGPQIRAPKTKKGVVKKGFYSQLLLLDGSLP